MSDVDSSAFRSFMGGLVDYAGLFPPASLDMAAAVDEYAAHRAEQEAWMLGRSSQPYTLRGGEAFYHPGRQIITVLDHVRLQTPDGQKLKTEALRYLMKFRKIKTAEDVWLGSEELQVEGGNLFYDLVDGNFRIGGRVRVDFP